jgi:hypothetical protein
MPVMNNNNSSEFAWYLLQNGNALAPVENIMNITSKANHVNTDEYCTYWGAQTMLQLTF